LLFPHLLVPGDQDVNVERPVERTADAEVEHATTQDEECALEAVLIKKVLNQN
jgi:hypothetical protein